MKKIKTFRNAVTFTSDLKVDEIKLLQAQVPSALAITEPTPEGDLYETFRVFYKDTAYGAINDNHILFVGADAEGYALVTVLIPANCQDRNAYLFENYGIAINLLKTVERNAKKALANLVTSKESFATEILDLDLEETVSEVMEEVEIIVKAESKEKGGKK